MESIAQLYKDVMDGVVEKTAADTGADAGPEFDQTFFQKVASGDEESVNALNGFIEESRAAGHSDEEIESAVDEAMQATGYEEGHAAVEDTTDEYEGAKQAAYDEGMQKALEDSLESDLAKEGSVSADDLVDFDLGSNYGEGYVEGRSMFDEAVEKIAGKKKAGKSLYQRLVSKMTPKGNVPDKISRLPRGVDPSAAELTLSSMGAKARQTGQRRAKAAIGGAAGAGAAATLGGAYAAGRKKDDKN